MRLEYATNRRHRVLNKVGYAAFAGILSLAYVSDKSPDRGAAYFSVAFTTVYFALFLLEVARAIVTEIRDERQRE